MVLSTVEDAEFERLLREVESETARLNPWEKGFVSDLIARYEKYGVGVNMSPKQWAALRKIHRGIFGGDDNDEG